MNKKVQGLVQEYKADPNCRPGLWIQTVGDGVTPSEAAMFLAAVSKSRPDRVKTWSLNYTRTQFSEAEKALLGDSAETREKAIRFFDILERNKNGISRTEYQEFQSIRLGFSQKTKQ
jgi:hypothetical protein